MRHDTHATLDMGRVRHWTWILVAIVAVLLAIGYGQSVDEQAAAEDERISARAFESGRSQGRGELLATVREAYAQGQRDAMAAVRGEATGVALLQACQAMARGSR